MEPSYRTRLFLAAREDFAKFWTTHRYWVTFVSLFVSPLVIQVLRTGMSSLWSPRIILESAGLGLGFSIVGNILIAYWNGAKSLDTGLRLEVANRGSIISERDQTIHSLTEKPKRSAAERHDYETAKKALDTLKEKGVIALRHIRKHGSLTFGTYNPVLAQGLSRDDHLWVYNHCASEGILTQTGDARNTERIFSVSPKFGTLLDELLFE